MIEVNEDISTGNLALRVSGSITHKQLSDLGLLVKKQAQNVVDPHILIIIENFKGWMDLSGLKMSRRLFAKYAGYFDRIAIVNDLKDQEQANQYFETGAEGEVKLFSIAEAEIAWKWIDQKPHL